MSAELLAWYSAYGLWVLAGVLVVAAFGVPLPATLLLLFTGALLHESQLNPWTSLPVALAAVVAGDHLGYMAGRLGKGRLQKVLARLLGGQAKLEAAEERTRQLGFVGVFLTRWLLTSLGAAVNVTSGLARYPYLKYTLAEVSGEVVWLAVYIGAGYLFYDRIQSLSDMLSNFSGAVGAIALACFLIWYLLCSRRRKSAGGPA